MPTAQPDDVQEVMDEIGVLYSAFDFPDESAYYDFIESRWNRVDRLIDDRIGVLHDEVAHPEQYDGHVFWTVSEILRRKKLNLLLSAEGSEGGFTIGRFKVESNSGAIKAHSAIYGLYDQLAAEIFAPFVEHLGQIGGAIFVGGTRSTPWASRPSRPIW